MQSDEKLKSLMTSLHQSLAAKVCRFCFTFASGVICAFSACTLSFTFCLLHRTNFDFFLFAVSFRFLTTSHLANYILLERLFAKWQEKLYFI